MPDILKKKKPRSHLLVPAAIQLLDSSNDDPLKPVKSILWFDRRGHIACYGQCIDRAVIQEFLNLNFSTGGTRVANSVTYPKGQVPIGCLTGYFVSGKAIHLAIPPSLSDITIALANVPPNWDSGEIVATPYQVRL